MENDSAGNLSIAAKDNFNPSFKMNPRVTQKFSQCQRYYCFLQMHHEIGELEKFL